MTTLIEVIRFVREFQNAELTGSRYFGNFEEESDYDFFMLDSQNNVDRLREYGFKCLTETMYNDSNCVAVWQYKSLIHVQLVISVEKKLNAQHRLSCLPEQLRYTFLRGCTKVQQRKIWEWAFETWGYEQ